MKLGVDIGKVIIDGNKNDGTDTSFFSDNYLKTSAISDSFETIAKLQKLFPNEIYLVSKCGKKTQDRTKEWLDHHDFWNITGVKPEQAFFCLERYQKAPICMSLGITHFVDDKLEVLSYLDSVPNKFLFCANPKEVARFASFRSKVIAVESWPEAYKAIYKSLQK